MLGMLCLRYTLIATLCLNNIQYNFPSKSCFQQHHWLLPYRYLFCIIFHRNLLFFYISNLSFKLSFVMFYARCFCLRSMFWSTMFPKLFNRCSQRYKFSSGYPPIYLVE
uniref:Uncharacterized protein n=1 Tax=Cacopsylla melanoneura TaxID=428564 RepID=A0A8D8U467_9HEMI